MQALVAEGMRQGALGLSTALQYPPAPYAHTEELIALAQTASRYGGIYATHMRSEGDAEMAALEETFRIGKEAQIPIEIFHLKASGKRNWGKASQVIRRIEEARAQGIDVAADTYAYTAWQNDFSAFIPPWAHDGGTDKLIERLRDPASRARIRKDMLAPSDQWDNEWLEIESPRDILISTVINKDLLKYQGKRISEIAAEWHEDPIDTICDFLIKDHAGTGVRRLRHGGAGRPADTAAALGVGGQRCVRYIARGHFGHGAFAPAGLRHLFPRILRKYVREEHQIGLPDAIRKFSALPAQRERLADRGVLKRGMWADVVVFDPEAIRDTSTYEDPNRFSRSACSTSS